MVQPKMIENKENIKKDHKKIAYILTKVELKHSTLFPRHLHHFHFVSGLLSNFVDICIGPLCEIVIDSSAGTLFSLVALIVLLNHHLLSCS